MLKRIRQPSIGARPSFAALRHRVVGFAVLLICAPAWSEVTSVSEPEVSSGGFVSKHTLLINGSPKETFRALTELVDDWWDKSHSYSGDAARFRIELRAGGCFCEESEQGVVVEHMRVARVIPNKKLVLLGGLGPLQDYGLSGSMSFSLEAHDSGTKLHYRYAVGGYFEGGFQQIAAAVDRVQLSQLRRLQSFVADREAAR